MHFYHSKNLPGWPEIAATFDHTRFHDNDNRIHVRRRNQSSHKHLDNESGFDRSRDGMVPDGLLAFFAYRGKIEGQNHKKHLPPQNALDQQADNKAMPGFYTCSISIKVPQKSLGLRKSTDLPWAPIRGSPSPRTRAPSRFSWSRAAMMSVTSKQI